jgi:5'-nucleotidase
MHILVTNDDGVQAPGLLALAAAMRPLGRVSVIAPDRNWSIAGHAKTLSRPLRVDEVMLADGTPALSCDGAPADCVALAVMGLIDEQPIDLVVSGINPSANMGDDIIYSGTVANAMEAAIWGLPAVAVSVDGLDTSCKSVEFAAAAHFGRRAAQQVIESGLPAGVYLNVNVPCLPLDEIQGCTVTRQGKRVYYDELIRRVDPFGRPYYWIGGDPPGGEGEVDTDVGALAAGYVSITPLQLDLTDHGVIEDLSRRTW